MKLTRVADVNFHCCNVDVTSLAATPPTSVRDGFSPSVTVGESERGVAPPHSSRRKSKRLITHFTVWRSPQNDIASARSERFVRHAPTLKIKMKSPRSFHRRWPELRFRHAFTPPTPTSPQPKKKNFIAVDFSTRTTRKKPHVFRSLLFRIRCLQYFRCPVLTTVICVTLHWTCYLVYVCF